MDEKNKLKIIIVKNGPYLVEGNIPLVKKTQIVSEYGEPLTWQTSKKLKPRRKVMPFVAVVIPSINLFVTEPINVFHLMEKKLQ